ncbi:MAG: hypothetical protein ACTHOF_07655 [Flavisolibacter sp.]
MKLIFAASTLCLGLFFTLSAMRPLSVRNTKTPEINSDGENGLMLAVIKALTSAQKKEIIILMPRNGCILYSLETAIIKSKLQLLRK